MNSYAERIRGCAVACLIAVCVTTAGVGAQSAEEFARRRLESGRAFFKAQNYVEGLRDFDAVLQSYPTSSVADDALLEIATYQLQVARDPVQATAKAKELLKTYPASDSAAMALVLEGRIALAVGRGSEDVNTALASFDRVPRLFPGSEAVPAAMYFGGEAARLGGRRDQALQRFSQLATQFPTSPWAAQALLGSAGLLTKAGQPGRAMEQLQHVRNQFPRSPEAAIAIDLNSVLYRLYLRAPAQTAFVFGRTIGGPSGKLRDVVDIALDADNTLLVASNTGVVSYGVKGNETSSVAAPEPRVVAFDRLGKMMTVHELAIRAEGRTIVPLLAPPVEGRPRQFDLGDAVVTASGDLLVADREEKSILRFLPGGKYSNLYASQINVRRMVINDVDDVLALDRDAKSVTLFNREGKILKQIAERGTNYQLRNPSDVAFDRLGHIYVLDRTALLVFAPDGSRLLTTFSLPEKAPGAIGEGNALALDTAGRPYVFDGRTDSVKVYR